MRTRLTILLVLLGIPILLLTVPSAAEVEARETTHESANPEELLGALLNTPVEWQLALGVDDCDRVTIDAGALRAILGLEECPEALGNKELQAVTIAAIQGLYEQIQKRDEILVELNDQNRTLQRQLTALEAQGREDRAVMARLERRLDTAQGDFERQVGSSPRAGPDTQSHQLAQRLSGVETERRGLESRLSRMETRLDTAISSVEGRTRDLQSRMSRLESRMMTLPRN